MKVFELKKRKDLKNAIHAIALVENPAIEQDFIYLSVEGKESKTNIYLSEEKGIIYSPVLIPDQVIPRVNAKGEKYGIKFSKETIEESGYDLMKSKVLDSFNEEHDSSKVVGDTHIVEMWIVDDKQMDKATKLGFDVPEGTLMAGIKVDDEATKQKIRDKKIKGISIEGLYEDFELVEDSGEKVNLNNQIMNKVEKTASELLTMLKSIVPAKETKLASIMIDENTTLYTEGEFSEGVMVYTDEAMTQPASGEFTVEGKKMTIAEGGSLVSVQDVSEESEEMNQVAMAQVEATVALSEKVTALEKENAELKEANASFKTELSKIKEIAEKNATLLSKVDEAEKESATTKLSAATDSESKANQYLSNRKYH